MTKAATKRTTTTASEKVANATQKAAQKGDGVTLIRVTTTKLLALVNALLRGYRKLHVELHRMACSSVYHAAEHGDVRPLNLFFDGLNVNYQTAFRFWIGRAFTAYENCRCMSYSKKNGWEMLPNTTKERENFRQLIEQKMLNPDGKEFKEFFERNVVTETLFYSDKDIVTAIKHMIKKAESNDDKVKSSVASETVLALKRALSTAEAHVHTIQ